MKSSILSAALAMAALLVTLGSASEAAAGWGRTRVVYAAAPAVVVTNRVVVPAPAYYPPPAYYAPAPAVALSGPGTTAYYAPPARAYYAPPAAPLVAPAAYYAPVMAPTVVRYRGPVIAAPVYYGW